MAETIALGFYESPQYAQLAAQELVILGIQHRDLCLLSKPEEVEAQEREETVIGEARSGQALIDRLEALGVPQSDARQYADGLDAGGGVVIARIDAAKADEVRAALEGQPVRGVEIYTEPSAVG